MTTTITNVKVSFRRSKQPAQYEASEPIVELNGAVEGGESAVSAASKMMRDAAIVVYRTLGMKDAEERVAIAFDDLIEEDGEVTVEVSGEENPSLAEAAGKTRRTRRTKAQIEADKTASTSTTADTTPLVSTTPSQPIASVETAPASPVPVQTTAQPASPAPSATTATPFDGLTDEAKAITETSKSLQNYVSPLIGSKLPITKWRAIISDLTDGKGIKSTDLATDEQRVKAYQAVVEAIGSIPPKPEVDLTSI